MHACIVQYTLRMTLASVQHAMYLLNYAGVFPFSLSFSPPHSHSHSHPTFTLPSFYLTAVLPFTAHHDINILIACPAHKGLYFLLPLPLPFLILPRRPHFFFFLFSLLPQPLGRRRRRRRRRTGVVVGLAVRVD